MKVEIKPGEGLKRELTVSIPADKVISEMDKAYAEVRRSVTLKGYRKGKAPMNMIKANYEAQVKADVTEDLIKHSLGDAVEAEKLRPATMPSITDIQHGDDGGLNFTAMVEVLPDIEKVVFDGLEITEEDTDVSDKEINDLSDHLLERFAEERPVEREATLEDLVVADLTKLADPKMVIKEDAFPGSHIMLSNPVTVKEFRDQIPGMKAGDEKEIEVVYSKEYPDAQFAGATLTYRCKVTEVRERITPSFDDEFAKKTGMAQTASELKEKIREDVSREKAEQQKRRQRNEIISQICENNQILVPEGWIEEYLNNVVKDMKEKDPSVTEEEIRRTHREMGINGHRWQMLSQHLVNQEKIEVSTEDTENMIKRFAENYKMTPEQAIEALNQSGRLNGFRENMLEDKLIDFLFEGAKKKKVKKA